MKIISTNYMNVLRNCVTAVLVITAEGNVILANRKACGMFGYSEPEILQLPATMLIEELQPVYEFTYTNTLTGTGELSGIHKESRHFPLRFFSVPFLAENGTLLTVLSLTDLTKAREVYTSMRPRNTKQSTAQEITHAVIEAREREREEIGRELHDNVNQILASAGLYLGIVKKECAEANPHLEETEMLIRKAIDELRGLSHSLIRPSLQKEDFMMALEDIITATSTGTHICIDKEVTGFEEKKVSEKLWLTVFRIIQEQFSNIIKYSEADKVHVKLAHEKKALLLSITDNGKGFDMAQKVDGVGLMNINTRASSNNGHAVIHSEPGKGCELRVMFQLG